MIHSIPGGRSAKAWPRRIAAPGLCLLLPALLAVTTGCGPEPPERLLYSLQGGTFGTYYVVKIVVDSDTVVEGEPTADEVVLPFIEEELEEVDRLMSTYRNDSEISVFNRDQSVEPVAVSDKTLEVMQAAIELAELTDGALDVTVGPLVEAWGFGPAAGSEPPDDQQLQAILERVGYDKLSVDVEAGTVSKAVPDLVCDLSSLAKGYGVDRVLERLRAEGFENILVEIGGEVRTVGINLNGDPWRLGIEKPADIEAQPMNQPRSQVQRVVSLEDEALATSGDYRRYREVDGQRVSHLLDPRTGQPIEHRLASVSVVDSTCMRADALATALMVMGEQDGFELAEQQGIAALFIVREGDGFVEMATSLFQERFMASGEA